jgi:hypothetical protein
MGRMMRLKEARATVEAAADKVVTAAGDTKRAIIAVAAIAVVGLLIALCGLALGAGAVMGQRRLNAALR